MAWNYTSNTGKEMRKNDYTETKQHATKKTPKKPQTTATTKTMGQWGNQKGN